MQTDNQAMSLRFLAPALLVLGACTPSLNWREMSVGPTALHATFPCKPDQVEQKVEVTPGQTVLMHALGCEAGGASFVVVWGDVGAAGAVADALLQWKKASAARSHPTQSAEQPWRPAGALGLAQSGLVRESGQGPSGKPLQSHAAYFARGTTIFQAAVYAPEVKSEMSEPFFTGLRFE
jgi:hypothetical protein